MQIKHNIETICNNSTYVNTYSKLYSTDSNRYYAGEKYITHTTYIHTNLYSAKIVRTNLRLQCRQKPFTRVPSPDHIGRTLEQYRVRYPHLLSPPSHPQVSSPSDAFHCMLASPPTCAGPTPAAQPITTSHVQ